MKDTHEANLPTEENGKLEETKAPETTPGNTGRRSCSRRNIWSRSQNRWSCGRWRDRCDHGKIVERRNSGETDRFGRSGGRHDTQRGGSTQTGLLQNPPERSGRIEESIPYSRRWRKGFCRPRRRNRKQDQRTAQRLQRKTGCYPCRRRAGQSSQLCLETPIDRPAESIDWKPGRFQQTI